MPYLTKIRPIDSDVSEERVFPEVMRQMPKSRLKRLFERQFTLKNASEKVPVSADVEAPLSRGNSGEFEPSSVCLGRMVQNFMEGNNGEKQRCGRSRCNCFSGSSTDESDDESEWNGNLDGRKCSAREFCVLKNLVLCTTISERNLLAHATKIDEANKNCKPKNESSLKRMVNGLVKLGYDAALCIARWEKSLSCPSGEHEYIDVIIKGERLLIDIDFKSKFEIARPTKTYKSILQTLPYIFVGRADRLQRIILLVCNATKQSLKKKGLHVPPWRRAEYVKSKWLAPHIRTEQTTDEERKQDLVGPKTKSVSSKICFSSNSEDNQKGDSSVFFGI